VKPDQFYPTFLQSTVPLFQSRLDFWLRRWRS